MLCQKPRYCDIAPSADAAARLTRYIERVDVEVRPHTEPAAPAPRQSNAEPRAKLRMALIGAIGTHKGYQVLLECSRDARKRKLPLDLTAPDINNRLLRFGAQLRLIDFAASGKAPAKGSRTPDNTSMLRDKSRGTFMTKPSNGAALPQIKKKKD